MLSKLSASKLVGFVGRPNDFNVVYYIKINCFSWTVQCFWSFCISKLVVLVGQYFDFHTFCIQVGGFSWTVQWSCINCSCFSWTTDSRGTHRREYQMSACPSTTPHEPTTTTTTTTTPSSTGALMRCRVLVIAGGGCRPPAPPRCYTLLCMASDCMEPATTSIAKG